jgi:protein-S-isoprenylcysteine O-methyltransferase Ste14
MANDDARPARFLKIPPPVWTLGTLAAAYGLTRSSDVAGLILFRSYPLAGAFGTAGFALAVWAVLTFLAEGTEIEPASPANKHLVTRGPFRFTRNPMYFGLILMSAGVAFYMGAGPFFAVPPLIFLLCHCAFIPFEEAKMARQHGAPYTDYCAEVRRWI